MGDANVLEIANLSCCTLWQDGLWSCQRGGAKLERFLPKNQHRKLLNFEIWCDGKLTEIGN